MTRLWRVLLVLGICAIGPRAVVAAEADGQTDGPAQAGPICACPDPFDMEAPAGIVWQGAGTPPDLPAIAALLAPAFWYSADEPLLLMRPNEPIPHPHPCDKETADKAVVYYQAQAIVLRSGERVEGNGEADPDFFEKVDHFVLRFYHYYDEDFGVGRHPHDLEVINMLVYLERTEDGCLRIRARRFEGLAHGVNWYSHILRTARIRDTVFPIHVLVEEGKHASILDRNADGVYTPGYDVTTQVNDAWGLRDVLGSSVMMGSRFSASMAKPRDDEYVLLPPGDAVICGRQRSIPIGRENVPNLGRYELRSAYEVPVCEPPGPEPERLRAMMRSHRFGSEWPVQQHESELGRVLADPENFFRAISAVNLRFDGNQLAASVQGPGLEVTPIWLVPRVLANSQGWAAEVLVTQSAARWFDPYMSMGYERGLIRLDPTDEYPNGEPNKGFATELGFKFRMPVDGWKRWLLLGYQFAGVRMGVRFNGFAEIRQPRAIIELGAGVF